MWRASVTSRRGWRKRRRRWWHSEKRGWCRRASSSARPLRRWSSSFPHRRRRTRSSRYSTIGWPRRAALQPPPGRGCAPRRSESRRARSIQRGATRSPRCARYREKAPMWRACRAFRLAPRRTRTTCGGSRAPTSLLKRSTRSGYARSRASRGRWTRSSSASDAPRDRSRFASNSSRGTWRIRTPTRGARRSWTTSTGPSVTRSSGR